MRIPLLITLIGTTALDEIEPGAVRSGGDVRDVRSGSLSDVDPDLRDELVHAYLGWAGVARRVLDATDIEGARSAAQREWPAALRARDAWMRALTRLVAARRPLSVGVVTAAVTADLETLLGPIRALPLVDTLLHAEAYVADAEAFFSGPRRDRAGDAELVRAVTEACTEPVATAEFMFLVALLGVRTGAPSSIVDWAAGEAYRNILEARVTARRLFEAAVPTPREPSEPQESEPDPFPWLTALEA